MFRIAYVKNRDKYSNITQIFIKTRNHTVFDVGATAVNSMIQSNLYGVNFVIPNTDTQALELLKENLLFNWLCNLNILLCKNTCC